MHMQDLAVVVLLMLIPLLAPAENGAQAAGFSKIARALGVAAVKVLDFVLKQWDVFEESSQVVEHSTIVSTWLTPQGHLCFSCQSSCAQKTLCIHYILYYKYKARCRYEYTPSHESLFSCRQCRV